MPPLVNHKNYYRNQIYCVLKASAVLAFIWLSLCVILACRINSDGPFASKTIVNFSIGSSTIPNLFSSYQEWAQSIPEFDFSSYIRGGLGFADGKGMFLKTLPQENMPDYIPFAYWPPGTSFLIGLMATTFGQQHIFPYAIFIMVLHFLTSVEVMILALRHTKKFSIILLSGILSLCALPILEFNYGVGLFMSEPIAGFILGMVLILLGIFWRSINSESKKRLPSIKQIMLAIALGSILGTVTYFRNSYWYFAIFICTLLLIVSLIRKIQIIKIAPLLIAIFVSLSAVQYPWKLHNKRLVGEYSMGLSSRYCSAMWEDMWRNYKEKDRWGTHAALGLGSYLDPDNAPQIMNELSKDRQRGAWKAFYAIVNAVAHHPIKALMFKLKYYDCFWLGERGHPCINIWCLVSLISFFVYIVMHKNQFYPELVALPLIWLLASPFIHWEARYVYPVYWLITPITLAWTIEWCSSKIRQRLHHT